MHNRLIVQRLVMYQRIVMCHRLVVSERVILIELILSERVRMLEVLAMRVAWLSVNPRVQMIREIRWCGLRHRRRAVAAQEPALRLWGTAVVMQKLRGRIEVMLGIDVHRKVRHRAHAASSRLAPNWTKSLALKPLDLTGISSPLALEVEVLANRVVKQTHDDKAY
jgi:hypothetical protein